MYFDPAYWYEFIKNLHCTFGITAFQVDMQKNYERRQYLAAMLLPDDPEQGR